MEFNAAQQFRPVSRSSSQSQASSRNVNQIMYPYGSFPAHQQAAPLPTGSRPTSQYGPWTTANTHAYGSLPRRNTTAATHAEGRPISQTQAASIPEIPGRSHPSSMNRAISAHTPKTAQGDMLPTATMDSVPWAQKAMHDVDFALDTEMADLGHGMLHHDEDAPIIDLRQYTHFDGDDNQNAFNSSRRMSESSFSMSSTGPMAEVPNYDDFTSSVAGSERLSYISDSDVWSSLEPPASACSPTASPRHSFHESMKNGARSRASTPYNVRSSPYSMDTTRNKRWSTGMYGPSPTPQRSLGNMNRHSFFFGSPLNPHPSAQGYGIGGGMGFTPNPTMLYSQAPVPSNGTPLFSTPDQFAPEVTRQLPSQGLFRLLQSNADRHSGCASHFADLADPPDLYSSLNEEPCDPPESDMNPEDPDLVPHEQELRFSGDLYTPRWVRGHGNKREGWCGLCKPGRWLVLKNSAFWYDKSFTHGVSAATGAAFQGPQETRRTEGNLDVWEGLCGSCGDWIALVSSKKKGTTWFRHAYKCHTHPKVKDGPKRRRETSNNVRARAPSSASGGVERTSSGLGFPPPKDEPLTALPHLPVAQRPKSASDAMMGMETVSESQPLFKIEDTSRDERADATTPVNFLPLTTGQQHQHQQHLEQDMKPQMQNPYAQSSAISVDTYPASIDINCAFSSPLAPAPLNVQKNQNTMSPLQALGGMI